MLTFLSIRNLALVDQLLWEPQDGFICITGETGAGKSVMIGAISLALGERADKSLIRSGEQNCIVEAVFRLDGGSPVHGMLDHHGMPPCEDGSLMVRRSISATDNRQFINDSPCTLNFLREVGSHLVDMHGSNDHRSLVSLERQLSLLDAYAENQEFLASYSGAWSAWQQAKREWNELAQAEAATGRELELLHHEVDEIAAAGFQREEVASLEERWQRARNSTRLLETSSKMLSIVDGDESASLSAQLRELIRSAHDLAKLDPSAETWAASLSTVEIEINEFESALRDYARNFNDDPEELAALENRINLLENLKRKYGPQFEDIMARYEESMARLDRIENRSERLAELEAIVQSLEKQVGDAGEKLSRSRKKAAPQLANEISVHLRDLGFIKSTFEIKTFPLGEPSATGTDGIEFLFGPNAGEPSKPLRLIASSGELARVMLAIKSALADKDATPLLVFDEIDSNVGGEVARSVGGKMLALGSRHQVISITHFPQVAAMARHHYLVEKALVKNRSISRLREVSGEERVSELVRMLGGGGEEAQAHARALLL